MKRGDVYDFHPVWNVKLTVINDLGNDKNELLELNVEVGGNAQFDYSIRQLRNAITYSSVHGILDIYLDNKWKSISENNSLTINHGISYRLRNHSDSPITFNMKIEPMHNFTHLIRLLYAFATLPYSEIGRKKHLIESIAECYQSDFEFDK